MRDPLNKPFDSCLSPIHLKRGDSKLFDFVPCGSCISCKKRKQSTWQSKLFHHLTCGKFSSLFITLTYDNEHLPLVTLSDLNSISSFGQGSSDPFFVHSHSSFTTFNSGLSSDPYRRTPLYSLFSSSDFDDYLYNNGSKIIDRFPHYVLSNVANNRIYDSSYTFAVCLKKDIQDFVKRLRTNISRAGCLASEDPTFTYFICSEYGPSSFRPHYHGILFFNSQRVAEWANSEGVFNSWKKQSLPIDSYGNKISSFINNYEANAAYVSKYVTCDLDLPFVLRFPAFKPFHLQSISTPIGSLAIDPDNVPNMLSAGDILCHTTYYDKHTGEQISINRPYPQSSWRRIFPKFLCHRSLSVSTISKLISRILQYKSVDDFPDYRLLVSSDYHLGDVVTIHSETKSVLRKNIYLGSKYPGFQNPYRSFYDLHSIAPRPFDFYDYPLTSSRVFIYTPSYVARYFLRDLGASHDSIDLFLFGIPENRTVAKIIHRFVNSSGWCRFDHDFYIKLYNQFFARCFSDNMALMYEYYNKHAYTLGSDSAALYDHIYNCDCSSDYFSTLHTNYTDYLRKQILSRQKKSITFDDLYCQL